MANQFRWVVTVDKWDELKRARYKIGCLLKEKKEQDEHMEFVDAQMEQLQDENHFLNHAKVHTCGDDFVRCCGVYIV